MHVCLLFRYPIVYSPECTGETSYEARNMTCSVSMQRQNAGKRIDVEARVLELEGSYFLLPKSEGNVHYRK